MRLKIFGERNSSTNAVRAVFKQSFSNVTLLPATLADLDPQARDRLASFDEHGSLSQKIQMLAPMKEAFIDKVFSGTGMINAWKHCATDFSDEAIPADVFIILMTRHPMSWLHALYKKPYHALQPLAPRFADFLLQPWQTVGRDRLQNRVVTPIELWNVKLLSYKTFLERHKQVKRIFVVKFEDFASSQVAALADTCMAMGLDSAQLIELRQSAKGEAKDSDWYRNYYQNELWRQEVSAEEWQIYEKHIDTDLSRFFGYET